MLLFQEAATLKAQAQALLRAADSVLGNKDLAKDMRTKVQEMRTALKGKWADLVGEPDKGATQPDKPATAPDTAGSVAANESARTMLEEAEKVLRRSESLDAKSSSLRAALKVKYPPPYTPPGVPVPYYDSPWPRDVFDDVVVYNVEGKTWRASYTIDSKQVATIGDPEQVEVAYVPVKKDTPAIESAGDAEISDEFIPLCEKAVRRDGTVPIKLIQPGWGTSGYYSKDVLQNDGPKVFTKGLKMFWDHPTPTEEAARPERSLRDLAAELVSDAKFDEKGAAGPGLYADAKVFSPFKETINELAPHIGVSIRGLGKAKTGTAEGRTGPLIEKIAIAKSADFVTSPGAGGEIVQLFEAARGKGNSHTVNWSTVTLDEVKRSAPGLVAQLRAEIKEAVYSDKNRAKEAQKMSLNEEQIKALQESASAKDTEIARLKEAILLTEASTIVSEVLGKLNLPDLTRARLQESLAKSPVVKDGAIDKAAFATKISEAVKAEVEYLARVTGSGVIKGMGGAGAGGAVNLDEASKSLEASFRGMGLSESAAKIAAKGREV